MPVEISYYGGREMYCLFLVTHYVVNFEVS